MQRFSKVVRSALFLIKGLHPGAGNAGSMFSWVPSQNTQNDHIWPKPRFSGPEPGFGPDEVILGCFGVVYTKPGHIWPKPMVLGMGLGQMWSVLV